VCIKRIRGVEFYDFAILGNAAYCLGFLASQGSSAPTDSGSVLHAPDGQGKIKRNGIFAQSGVIV
jgi:hypothetical protein